MKLFSSVISTLLALVFGKGKSAAGCFLLFLFGSVSMAVATDVTFDSASYSISGNEVTLSMVNIQNHASGGNSGSLRMELWALSSPYAGTSGSGYRLGYYQLNALDGGYYYSSVSETVSLATTPPDGTYDVAMLLTEYTGTGTEDGYQTDNYVNFNNQLVYGTPTQTNGANFGFSSAVSLGDNWYYDSDVQYLYPFGTEYFYLLDQNKYFYISPGTDFTTGAYIFDFYHESWTYAYRGYWPYVYYYNGVGWEGGGFD